MYSSFQRCSLFDLSPHSVHVIYFSVYNFLYIQSLFQKILCLSFIHIYMNFLLVELESSPHSLIKFKLNLNLFFGSVHLFTEITMLQFIQRAPMELPLIIVLLTTIIGWIVQ